MPEFVGGVEFGLIAGVSATPSVYIVPRVSPRYNVSGRWIVVQLIISSFSTRIFMLYFP